MCAYKYLSEAWRNLDKPPYKDLMRRFVIEWRKEPTIKRIEKPTRIDKARRLGYKAKQGFVVVRVRVRRGGARKLRPASGRRQKAMGVSKYTRAKSIGKIAEERVARKYPNLKVLNSYPVWKDGSHRWYEVILVDPNHPAIKSDPDINWICG